MADGVPTVDELKKLKVVELKARLSSLGLQTSGLKADLIVRLHNYFVQQHEAALAQQQQQQQQQLLLLQQQQQQQQQQQYQQLVQHQHQQPQQIAEQYGGGAGVAEMGLEEERKFVPMKIIHPGESMEHEHAAGPREIKLESDREHLVAPVVQSTDYIQEGIPVAVEESEPTPRERVPDLPLEHQTAEQFLHQVAEEPTPEVAQSGPQEAEGVQDSQKEISVSVPEQREEEPSTELLSDETQQEELQQDLLQRQAQDEQLMQRAEILEPPQVEPSRGNLDPPAETTAELGVEGALEEASSEFSRQPVAPAVEDSVETTEQALPEMVEADEPGELSPVNEVSGQEAKGKKKKKKKKKKKRQPGVETNKDPKGHVEEEVEVEYIEEAFDTLDPNYRQFAKIFEAFKLSEPEAKDAAPKKSDKKEAVVETKTQEAKDPLIEEEADADDDDSDEEDQKPAEPEQPKLSKKKLRKLNRLSVAELKQLVPRPDVVEMHDVTAHDPKLLVFLKSCRNTVPVPRHWCFKRKYLQGKRGIVKPPFDLPDFIKKTGIMEMREAMQEKEDQKTMKAKMREKVRPKMGKIDIDYQKLHDAFFKWQTKPKMTIHGDLYYEGKEFETKLKLKKPGDLSDDLRTALGMPIGPSSQLVPPPWLIAMQRYGPPPSYPNLKIPGLNAPIPEGASFGYHAGGWGKPPVDETGRPLYGDVFGIQLHESQPLEHDDQIESQTWGELESEESEEESEEESSEEEDQTGLITPADTGLITPSGLTSIPAGMETPDIIELRKRKNIEEAMESGAEQASLYTVLQEKRAAVGAVMMGSSHVYEMPSAVPGGAKKAGTTLTEGVEVALDPSELELDPAAMQARYEQQLKERESQIQKEDLSDMVAEHAAKQKKRKKATDSGKAAKKYKEFKF